MKYSKKDKRSEWNIESIKVGIERFVQEHDRLPRAREMDKVDYLPTARTVQRTFGGVQKLRQALGFNITHFGKGKSRTDIAELINKRGRAAEYEVKVLLEEQFGEMFVHLERPFAKSSKQRLDFYIFSPSGNFGVDVFYPQDLDSLIRIINIKEGTYKGYPSTLYFLAANKIITQTEIDKLMNNKKRMLPKNFKVITFDNFQTMIKAMQRYSAHAEGE